MTARCWDRWLGGWPMYGGVGGDYRGAILQLALNVSVHGPREGWPNRRTKRYVVRPQHFVRSITGSKTIYEGNP